MSEEFLYYIWQNHLFDKMTYELPSGEKVEIISPGQRNFDAGPDFINTQIKIENTLWAGNCEIHIFSSDWYKHMHHTNFLYDNVIIHVVYKKDIEVTNSKGNLIPTIEISFNYDLFNNYQKYINTLSDIPCHNYLKKIDRIHITSVLEKCMVERLHARTMYIHQILQQHYNDWETCAFILLGKAFGFKTNELPFELLMRSIPINVLQKYAHRLFSLEALLMGQAGLLTQKYKDEYPVNLLKEYEYLKKKHSLQSIDNNLWKKMRIRPANFPTIRIAELAAFIHKHPTFFQKLLEVKSLENLYQLFEVSVSKYWNNHYQFDSESKSSNKKLSHAAIQLIAINTLVPLLFAYGKEKNNELFKKKALQILEEIKAEENTIIKKWKTYGVIAHNAMESQALLQLYNQHCLYRKCLQCNIFHQIMNLKNHVLPNTI